MKCPIDGSKLLMSERQGVEVDFCPDCRGIWLDRGELDKIIERLEDSPQDANYAHSSDGHTSENTKDARNTRKRKESWLSELFG